MNTEETHEKFLQGLRDSESAKWFWARWLSENRKMEIHIKPTTFAATHKDWEKHIDDGDIYGKQSDQERFSRYEVRHLIGTEFTSLEDWPHQDFIVSACHAFEQSSPRPATYFCLNPLMTHVAYLNVAASREDWFIKTVYNKRYDREQTFYYSPLEHVTITSVLNLTI
jgi:hypothetical protein